MFLCGPQECSLETPNHMGESDQGPGLLKSAMTMWMPHFLLPTSDGHGGETESDLVLGDPAFPLIDDLASRLPDSFGESSLDCGVVSDTSTQPSLPLLFTQDQPHIIFFCLLPCFLSLPNPQIFNLLLESVSQRTWANQPLRTVLGPVLVGRKAYWIIPSTLEF